MAIGLVSFSAPLRTDEEFISRKDNAHHTAMSPFTGLQFGMVSNFPLDYMHLICLGVVRRLVHLFCYVNIFSFLKFSIEYFRRLIKSFWVIDSAVLYIFIQHHSDLC